MPDFNDIPTGLRTPAQIPLDVKSYIPTYADLLDLGVDDNKAYTYYEGLRINCVENNKIYVWREALPQYGIGALPQNFLYPNGLIVFGIDYSNREFNFYEKPDYIDQDNFVRVIYVDQNTLPIDFSLQDICDHVLALPNVDKTIEETDSKLNIAIGPIDPISFVLDVNFIFEVINIGKGIIVALNPVNLLLIERKFAETKVKEAVIYFTRAHIMAVGFRLIHNLGVVRYLSETFSYSNEMFRQSDTATLTPLEMIDKGVIRIYNYLDPNEIELEGFANYKPFISNNDVVAYYVRYIGADVEEIIVPDKFLTYLYNNTQLPATNTYYLNYTSLTGGLYSTYGAAISKIRITQLPATAQLTLSGVPLNVNDEITVDQINSDAFVIWIDKIDGSGPTGNYTDLFKYVVVDILANESNVVTFNFNAIDEVISGLVYLDDSPLSKNVSYTAGTASLETLDLLQADLLVNVVNSFGNPTVGIKIFSLPNRGELAENGWPVALYYTVPLIEIIAGKFKFFALGVDGLGAVGDFGTSFTFKLVDSAGYNSNLVTFNINATQNFGDYLAQISWFDTNTTEQRNGVEGVQNIELNLDGTSVPVSDSIVQTMWQRNVGGSGWNDVVVPVGPSQLLDTFYGMNQHRIKITTNLGVIFYSNIIEYLATIGVGTGSGSSSGTGSGSSGGGSGSGSSGGGGNDPIQYS